MGKKLFPKEIIDDSSEANFSKHSVQTKLIYITVLVALVSIFIALPLINVTVSVKSPGVVQPLTNRSQLVSLVSGHIEELFIEENTTVVRGQTVAKISAPVLEEQNNFNVQRQEKISGYLSDLSLLLSIDETWFIDPAPVPQEVYESVSETEDERESSENVSDTPSTEEEARIPAPLFQFKDQMLVFRDQILNATSTLVDGNSENDLQKARTGLWKLLNIDMSYLVGSGEENRVYQEALATFQQQINDPLQRVAELRETHNQNQLFHDREVLSDTAFEQSKQDLDEAWDELLTTLGTSSLATLSEAVSEEENDGNSNTTADEDNPEEDISVPAETEEYNQVQPESKELNLETAKYRSSLLEFKQQARNNIQQIRIAQIKYNRDKQLYDRGVISEENFEETSFALENAQNDFQLLFEQQRNQWQADETTYQDELEQLNSDREQISKEQERHVITAPISGTIQNMQGIYEGSSVAANQALAEISPDTSLIVECYVPPKDIGLLREGMEARFQVTAYDYNQWGLLTGTIVEISGDVMMMNDQPVFKVRASLDQTWLELQNGYRGNLKKGMSLLARFKVTERSLFQLLYDNLDDWLNPKWDDPNQAQVPVQQASASR